MVYSDPPSGGHSVQLWHLEIHQHQVLLEVADGLSNKEIGRSLHISEATVKTHLLHIFAKLGVDDRSAAVTVALERGIIRLDRPAFP
jgi:DNA-binding NarL/FixJ family response regulator